MADLSDVEKAMVTMIASFLGLGQNYLPGSAVPSVAAQQRCTVYRGWPIANALDDTLAKNITTISVFPLSGATRRTTRYLPRWNAGPAIDPQITAVVDGASVILNGFPVVGQVVGVRFGTALGGVAYAYRIQQGDTLAAIAAALAAQVVGASSVQNILTLPSSLNVIARASADQTSWMETRRQMQHIWVTGWSTTPAARDRVMSIIDSGFANMTDAYGNLTYFIPLPDGSFADLRYYSNTTVDKTQTAKLWRRDIRYTVEYATTLLQTHPEVLFPGSTLTEIDSDLTETISF